MTTIETVEKEFTDQILMSLRGRNDKLRERIVEVILSQRTELLGAIETFKITCHENNHQRGCVDCVDASRINNVLENLKEKLQNI
jgi:hypothetical protein